MDQTWKKAVLWVIVAVAVIGTADAFLNLPVLTGCGFYGACE